MASSLSLTDPTGWRRLGQWLSLGLWNPDKGVQTAEPPASRSATGIDVGDTRAMQVTTAFSCIKLIAEICGSLPLPLYRRNADGTREEVRDHWLAELLRNPNPEMTEQEFREAMFAGIASWGNAYAETPRRLSDKRPLELWPLKPSGMQVERTTYETVAYKYSRGGGKGPKEFGRDQVWHVKGFGTDGFIGLSPLGMARQALALSVSAEDYAGSFYANGGQPKGVMKVDKILKQEQRDQIRKEFAGLADSKAADGNRLWLLEAAMDYHAISIPPEHAQMLQTRQFQIAELARIFRVPLFLLMEMEKSTSWGTGLEQQNLAFLAYSLRPYLTRFEKSVNRWLLNDEERKTYYVEHNVEGLLRADSKARAEFYASATQNGWMSRNEVRAKENLAPQEGGDALTAQTNLAPLDMLGKIKTNGPAEAGPSVSGA